MKMKKKLIIVTLILLSLFMIGAVSAATNTTDVVNSDVSNDNGKVTTTTTNDVSDSGVDKTSKSADIGTDDSLEKTEKRSTKNDTDNNIKETSTSTKKIKTSTSNEDLLKDENPTPVNNWDELENKISSSVYISIILDGPNEYIADKQIEINSEKVTINGNGKTINAQGQNNMFNIHSGVELILENLQLINGKSDGGGAIINKGILTLINCTFINNQATGERCIGGAIYTLGTVNINNTIFTNNAVNDGEGGAIYAEKDTTVNINNTIFNKNNATRDGGAIYTLGTVNINNTQFTENKAIDWGGAIYAEKDTTVNINNTIFNKNNAKYGGAIYTWGTVNIDNSIFNKNNATRDGGAIYATNSATVNINNTQFTENNVPYPNTGGAIYAMGTVALINNLFKKNSALHGGAIYSSNGDFSGVNNGFIDNDVKGDVTLDVIGGKEIPEGSFSELYAMLTTGTTGPKTLTSDYTYNKTEGSSDSEFIGGIPINTTVHIIGNGHTIDGNHSARIFNVTRGGQLTLENITLTNGNAYDGGAINAEFNSNINITTSILQNNNAQMGGAIYANNAKVTINNSTIQNNQATGVDGIGGAIYADNSQVNITQSILQNNQAGYEGGAIYVGDSQVNITQSILQNNNAIVDGGIGAYNSNITINSSTLQNNTAKDYGGAIYVRDSQVNITQSILQNNQAGYEGGAIEAYNSQVNITQSILQNNNAQMGGAIYTYSGSNLTINHNIFLNNTGNKVISLVNSGTVNLDYNWFGNTADNYTDAPNVGTGLTNWLFLNAADSNPIIGLTPTNITFKLFLYNSSSEDNKISSYDNSQLKPVNLTINSINGTVNPENVVLGNNITYTPSNFGTDSITASIANIEYSQEIKIAREDSFTALYENITKYDTLTLDHDYIYDPSTDTELQDGIPINKTITINGNGHTISGNNTARIFKVTNAGHLTLENITLTNGNAYDGGAIAAYKDSHVNINNSTIQNNQATRCGGAIYAYEGFEVNINNSTIQNNQATYGGAIYFESCIYLNINNSTIQNNNANSTGGAIYAQSSKVNINNSTIQNNQADNYGGAIWGSHAYVLTVNHNIFLNNSGDNVIYLDTCYDVYFDYNIFLNNSGDNVIYLDTCYDVYFDCNWFGHNATDYTDISRIINNNSYITNWLFLNATANPNPVQVLNTTNITFELFLYNSSSENVTSYDNSQLIPVNFTITSTNGDVEPTTAGLNDTITYKANNYGKCSVTATIDNVECTIEFNIKYPTRFTIENINDITEGDSINLIINEANNYTGPVTVTIGSKNYTVTLTDGSGKTSITNLKPGTYTAIINFPGNDEYENATANSNTFKVNSKPSPTPSKISTKIVAKQKTFKLSNKNKKYTITLKDKNNKAIKNAQVTLKVKGKTYKAKTNKKGKATFKLTKLNKKGTYKATIKYNGNKKYKKSSKKVKITIQFQNIGKNSKNKALVKKIQKALKQKGYYKHAGKYYLMIDGKYQTWTTKEVKRYQKNHGLKVTGTVDDQTAQKLGII